MLFIVYALLLILSSMLLLNPLPLLPCLLTFHIHLDPSIRVPNIRERFIAPLRSLRLSHPTFVSAVNFAWRGTLRNAQDAVGILGFHCVWDVTPDIGKGRETKFIRDN